MSSLRCPRTRRAVSVLLAAGAALVVAAVVGSGCASAPPPAPRWPEFGLAYAFEIEIEIDRGPIFEVTFRDPDVLSWRRLRGTEVVRSGTSQPYRLVRLRSGMVLVTWRDGDGTTVTFVTDTFSWEVSATISRPGDPVLMHGRVRPAGRIRGIPEDTKAEGNP